MKWVECQGEDKLFPNIVCNIKLLLAEKYPSCVLSYQHWDKGVVYYTAARGFNITFLYNPIAIKYVYTMNISYV